MHLRSQTLVLHSQEIFFPLPQENVPIARFSLNLSSKLLSLNSILTQLCMALIVLPSRLSLRFQINTVKQNQQLNVLSVLRGIHSKVQFVVSSFFLT